MGLGLSVSIPCPRAWRRLGSFRQEDKCIDLNTIIEKVKLHLKQAIEESGAIVTSGDLPSVHGQDARFVQLFQNLIGNGIKYRAEAPPLIRVSAEQRDGEWCFLVADNGIGIEPEYHQMIFGVFKRLHGDAIPGAGMGLAICAKAPTLLLIPKTLRSFTRTAISDNWTNSTCAPGARAA